MSKTKHIQELPKNVIVKIITEARESLAATDYNTEATFEELKHFLTDEETKIAESQLRDIIILCAAEESAEYDVAETQSEPLKLSYTIQEEIFSQIRLTLANGNEDCSEIIKYYSETEQILSEDELKLFCYFVMANKVFIELLEKEFDSILRKGKTSNISQIKEKYPSQPVEKMDFLIKMMTI